jgi:hypothetical protein
VTRRAWRPFVGLALVAGVDLAAFVVAGPVAAAVVSWPAAVLFLGRFLDRDPATRL